MTLSSKKKMDMTKEKNTMKSEEKKNQEQLNKEQTNDQQSQSKDKTSERNKTQENEKEAQNKDLNQETDTKKDTNTKEQDQRGAKEKEQTAAHKEEGAQQEKKSEKETHKDKNRQQEKTVEEPKKETKEKSDREKLAELQDKYLRLTAEYDNYRRRTLREKMELTKSAGEDILKGLLPIMDDFERAMQSIDESGENQAVKDGIHLIYNKFNDFLKQQGVQEIEAQDQEFNTDRHEAISKIPAPSEDMKGKVVDVVQKGYHLNDKVIRFAKVVVGE